MSRPFAYPLLNLRSLFFTVGLCAAALFIATPGWGEENRNDCLRQVTVSGFGEVHAVPDKATLSAGIISLGDNAAQALEKNTAAMQALFQALTRLGIAQKIFRPRIFPSPRAMGAMRKAIRHLKLSAIRHTITSSSPCGIWINWARPWTALLLQAPTIWAACSSAFPIRRR